MSRPLRDVLLGCCTLAVAAAYYASAAAMPASLLDDAVGPAGMPRIYGALLALLSLVTIARGGLAWRAAAVARPSPVDDAGEGRTAPLRAVGLLALGALYVAIVPTVGYLAGVALLLFATTWYQARRVTRTAAVVAVSGAVGLWLLFVAILGIQQPAGLWPSLF